MKKILVTGGAGFLGVHFLEHIFKETDWNIVSLDRLDTSGNLNRMSEMLEGHDDWKARLSVVFHDLKAEISDQVAARIGGDFDYIVHIAAGSHVDRSIEDPTLFFQDNCMGTVSLLNYVRNKKYNALTPTGRFLYFGTDEVYGPAAAGQNFKEWDRMNPNNPYAAAKAAAEMATLAYANTYSIPSIITNTMNIYGERQLPEKFIPLAIKRSLSGERIDIHADADLTHPGQRHYIHARNVSAAVVWILQNGKSLNRAATEGRYNIVGEKEMDNLELAKLIHGYVKKYNPDIPDLNAQLVSFHAQRPGHDLRYALDGQLLSSEGFVFPMTFEDSIERTIKWTLDHKNQWL